MLLSVSIMSFIYTDIPTGIDFINFQDSATDMSEHIRELHCTGLIIILLIIGFVLWMLLFSMSRKDFIPRLYVNDILEFGWTLVPIVILWALAIQSVGLLYTMDEVYRPELTISVIGNQWYWEYQYNDYPEKDIVESRMCTLLDTVDMLINNNQPGQYSFDTRDIISLQFLEVDYPLYIPTDTNIRILVTSSDVIHSWAVPSFGVKIDAIPGRLNMGQINVSREGIFYGQCSELCGVMHGFMPIKVVAVEPTKYISSIC